MTEDADVAKVKREEDFFDQLAELQEDSWWGHKTFAGKERQWRRAHMVSEFLSPVSEVTRILEIGCGGGDFTMYLMGILPPCRYIGIDASEGLLKVARRRIVREGVTFHKGDVMGLEESLGLFDAVIGASILHHLDIPRTLSNVYHRLKPGGKILFMEPNMRNPQIWLERNVKFIRRIAQNTEDETAFYRSQMVSALWRAGFAEISVKLFDFLHPLVPKALVPLASAFAAFLENMPVAKEFAGSLMIQGRKPLSDAKPDKAS